MLGSDRDLQPVKSPKPALPQAKPSWQGTSDDKQGLTESGSNGTDDKANGVEAKRSDTKSAASSMRGTPPGFPSTAPPVPGVIKTPPLPPLTSSPSLQPQPPLPTLPEAELGPEPEPEPDAGTESDVPHPLSASPAQSSVRRQRVQEYEENQRQLHSASLPPSITPLSSPTPCSGSAPIDPSPPQQELSLPSQDPAREQAEPVPGTQVRPSTGGSAASAAGLSQDKHGADAPHHAVDILADPKELDAIDTWEPDTGHLDPRTTDLSPVLVAREEYIPVRVARDKLQHVCAEMARVKHKHLEALEKVEAHYNKMKAAAEARVKEYVATLKKRHEAEMRKQVKAHQEKMKRVRLDLLGNVDDEVRAAKDMILQLEEEEKQKHQVAEKKIAHERVLLEEQKASMLNEIETLKNTATEKQRTAEEALLEEKDKHKIEFEKANERMRVEISEATKEQEERLQAEADLKLIKREEGVNARLREMELKESVKTNELKIERARVQEEAQEAKALNVSASKAVTKSRKINQQVQQQKQEMATMLTIDLQQSFLLEKEPLLNTIKELEETVEKQKQELAAKEQELAAKVEELAATSEQITQHTTTLAAREASEAELAKQMEELRGKAQEQELAASAHAEFEAQTLEKLEAYEKMKSQNTALKEQAAKMQTVSSEAGEKLGNQLKAANASVLELQNKLNDEVQKHHQTRQEAKKLTSLTLDGKKADLDTHEQKLETRMQEMKAEEDRKREAYEEEKARLENELKATAQNLEESEKSRLELQKTLAAAVEGNDESSELMKILSTKDEEVTKLRAVQQGQQEELEKKAAEIRDNLISYNEELAKRDEKHKAAVAPLMEQLQGENKRVEGLKDEMKLIAARIEEGQGEPEELEQLRAQLQEKEDAVDEANTQIHGLRVRTTELETEQEVMRAQLASKFSEYDEKQIAHHNELKTQVQETNQKQEEAHTSQQKLRQQLVEVSEGDADEVAQLKNKLSEEDERVAANNEALAELQKNKAKMHEDMVAMSEMMRQQQELESQIRGLKKVIAEKDGTTVVVAAGAGHDPKLKAKYDKLVAEKKKLAAQLKEALSKVEKQKEEVESAKAEAGAAAVAAKEGEVQKEKEELEKEIKRLEKASGKANEISKELEKAKKLAKEKHQEVKAKQGEIEKLEGEHKAAMKEQRKKYEALKVAAGEAEGLKEEAGQLRVKNKELSTHATECEEQWKKEAVLRKKYFNEIQDLKGKIRVMVRCRPMNSIEKGKESETVVHFPDDYGIEVPRKKKEFLFDHVFNPTSEQDGVWEESKHFVQSAVDGYNTCIFAYGQTGSGKTWTMEGSVEQPGVTPRCINEVFETLEGLKSRFSYSVSCYMLELYTDNLYDLLLPKNKKKDAPHLDIKKDAKGMVLVQGSTILPVKSREELALAYMEGCKQRHTRSTGMNAASSRSHLVFGVLIETQNKSNGKVTTGKMSLVDLAGSERMDKTGIKDEAGQKEAKSINKSLTALGDVISALSTDPGGFIPYRNNKLTLLMSDSLGGNAKTMMIAAVSPASYNVDETVNTLAYAARTKLITNDASKAVESKEIARLKAIIAKLKAGDAVEEDA